MDGNRNLIHSISKDKKYRLVDYSTTNLLGDFEPGNFELTYLVVDEQRNKSFIGDRNGSIYIFNTDPVFIFN